LVADDAGDAGNARREVGKAIDGPALEFGRCAGPVNDEAENLELATGLGDVENLDGHGAGAEDNERGHRTYCRI